MLTSMRSGYLHISVVGRNALQVLALLPLSVGVNIDPSIGGTQGAAVISASLMVVTTV